MIDGRTASSPVRVAVWSRWPETVGAVSIQLLQRAGWNGPHRVYAYTESVSKCSLVGDVLVDAWRAPDDAMEGRLFDANAEVRWLRKDALQADGSRSPEYSYWVVRELGSGEKEPTGTDVECASLTRLDRPYVLLGRGTPNAGEFREARYPGVVFRYPVDAVAVPPESGRAVITVAEYRRSRPTTWGDERAVRAVLASPLLTSHRFVSVSLGSGDS